MVVNYQDGKIYCIRSHQTDDIYIGSTTQPLSVRMAGHRRHYKHWKEGKMHYVTSFQLLEYDDCYIELIEEYPCDSKMELERREGQLIREMDCVNKCIVGRTQKEYAEEHKERRLQQSKEWREANREKLKQYQKQYQQDNKEHIAQQSKEWREANREKLKQYQKQYHQANKEQILHQKKQYYEDNREKITQRMKEKLTCECGGVHSRMHKARHERSKKHQEYISNKIIDTVD
jgi:hypothetical protein